MINSENGPGAPARPRFILDTPASQDELGAHGRVADAIVEVVRHDDRIKTIGLLGGWGSGKSTVIRLVEEGLHRHGSGPQIYCFTYDAWLHQSDPPRRAFLEVLVAFLQRQDGFEDLHTAQTAWRSKLDALNKQTETTETTTTPTLTKAGLWYLPTLLFVPLGLRLIGNGTPAADATPAGIAMFVLGWMFALGPVLAAAGIYFAWRPKLPMRDLRFWTTHRHPHDGQSILSVIANKHVESKQELKARSPEPTAIEFQEAFREIMAVAQTERRRLLIVVDNLDRLPADEAMTIWATIRSFFLGADGANHKLDRSKLPTVVMPIDEASISRIYGAPDDATLSRSFIEKTFDLVFHVPGPVLSRWHQYLRQRLAEVFGDTMPADWPYVIGTVYETWLGRSGTEPTPRAINTFVNSLAVAWMQLNGQPIHIGVVAHFVTARDAIGQGIHQAVQGENPMLDRFDPEWRPSIAALHYGVALADASELFMEGPIRSATQSGDQPSFAKLAAVPGFDRYYLKVLDEGVWVEEPLWVFGAAALLASLPSQNEPWVVEAWRRLRQLTLSMLPRRPFSAGDTAAFVALIESCDGAERSLFLRSLVAALQTLSPDTVQREDGAPFAEAVRIVVEQALAAGLNDVGIVTPGGSAVFMQVLRHHLPVEVTRALHPSGELSAVIEHLAERLRDPLSSTSTHRVALALALRGPDDLNWVPLLDTANELLQHSDATLVSSAATLVRTLYIHVSAVRDRVSTWRDHGVLAQAFGVAWTSSIVESVVEVTALGMKAEASLHAPDGRGWDEKLVENPDIPRLTDAAFRHMGAAVDFEWLVRRLKAQPFEAPLLRAIAARLFEDDQAPIPTPDVLFADPEGYLDILPPGHRPAFWGKASEQKDFWAGSESLPIGQAAPVLHAIMGSDVNKALLGKALQKRLQLTSAAEWDAALRQGVEPMGLVVGLENLERSSVTIGPEALNHLRAASNELLTTPDEGFRRRWFALASRLSAPNRKTLFKVLRDSLTGGALVAELRSLLAAGGASLLAEGEFQKVGDGSTVHLVLPLIQLSDGRAWLLEHVSEVGAWVARSDASTRITLTEQLEAQRSAGESQAGELLTALEPSLRASAG